MAIKVGGTSVISDSLVLQNVTGLKTVDSTSLLGSGNISTAASVARGSKSGTGTVSTGIANALVYGIGLSGNANRGYVAYTTDSSGDFTYTIYYSGEVLYWIVVK